LQNILGDSYLLALSVAFLGPFNRQFRAELLRDWVGAASVFSVPCSAEFSIQK